MKTVETQLDKSWRWRLGCLGLLILPLPLWIVIAAVRSVIVGEEFRNANGAFVIAAVGVCAFLYFPFHARLWVKRFDEKGVTLRGGRFFPWSEYEGLTRLMRGDTVKRYRLQFKTGHAHVVPLMIANYDEVRPVMDELQQPPKP